jgi:hypothetical protein
LAAVAGDACATNKHRVAVDRPISGKAAIPDFLYFDFQMKMPPLRPLDTSDRAVRIPLLCQAILDHMNRELAISSDKHSKTRNCFASRP